MNWDTSFVGFAVRYSFRSLWRTPRRTTLTMSAVLLSTAVAIISTSFSAAIMKLWQDGAADTGSAHAQIHAKGYWEKLEGLSERLTLPEGSKLEEIIFNDDRVEVATRRLELEGMLSTGERSLFFLGKGVEGDKEMQASPRLFTKNDLGKFVDPNDRTGAAIAEGLADALELELGAEVTLIAGTIQGSVNGIDIQLNGLVDANIPSFTNREVFVNLPYLQRLIRMPDRYTELAVRLKPDVDAEKWVEEMKLVVAHEGAEIRGWWEIEPVIKNVEAIWDAIILVTTSLLFLSTAISVLNIIFMMVAERTVEIGTIMALGARPKDVQTLFSVEALLIGIFGAIMGALLGNFAVMYMDIVGIPFKSPFGTEALIIHPKVNLWLTLITAAAAVLICMVAAIVPSRKAAAVEPVSAFRGQIT